jgi:hypothetical protein
VPTDHPYPIFFPSTDGLVSLCPCEQPLAELNTATCNAVHEYSPYTIFSMRCLDPTANVQCLLYRMFDICIEY